VELVEAYKKAEQQEKREKHIGRVKNAVAHLTSVLNDFLSLSKLEEGHIEMHPEYFQFESFCREIVGELRLHLRPGQIIEHHPIGKDVKVFLDKKCLRHILFNLVSNAIKYSPENSLIECTSEVHPDRLAVIIRDYGIGIPKEDQKHLFTRFFRAHNVENIKGTGLGLNIVRRYVELLDGKIEFESEEGKGTVFRVEIPLPY
jgi:signal transduction histidine kinase